MIVLYHNKVIFSIVLNLQEEREGKEMELFSATTLALIIQTYYNY